MYQFIKTYAVAALAPTAFIGCCFLLALILWKRAPRVARSSLITGGVLFFLLGINPLTEALLSWYEGQYPGFEASQLSPTDQQEIRFIVVLGGGFTQSPRQPVTSQLSSAALPRLVEGVRLWHALPHTTLVVSGAGWETITEAEAMSSLAQQLGVPAQKIIVEKFSTNTFEHTKYLAPIIGKAPFVVVTSANHMPRTMKIFHKAGLSPYAAPTGHILSGEYQLLHNKPPYPRGDNLNAMDTLFYEWVGMIWGRLKGEL